MPGHLLGALLVVGLTLAGCGTSLENEPIAADPGGQLDFELLLLSTSAAGEPVPTRLDGATITGTVTIVLRSDVALDEVRVFLDGDAGTEPSVVFHDEPWGFELDARTLASGPHTLRAAARLAGGSERDVTATFNVNHESDEPDEPDDVADPVSNRYTDLPPATLYVATDGDDQNDGRSIERPLRTLQRAADIVEPGDTVYVRGGVYPIQVAFTRSGTPERPITWTSHPGELAILDGSDQTPVVSGHRVWITNASWNVLANFEIRHGPREGIILQNAHDNVLTHLVVHSHHTSGILAMTSDRNRFQYIVTHNNYDLYNPSGRIGDDADGISISTGDRNVLYRVIAYNNSDDGIDTWRSTNTLIDSCISFSNGRGTHGNGTGIKAGGNSEPVHTLVRNTIAFHNRGNGFDDNSGEHVVFVNNTGYANGRSNFSAGPTAALHNNLSVDGQASMYGGLHTYNNWNLPNPDPGVASTDPLHPSFLTLQPTSPAIQAGTGQPPTTHADLGALPYGQSVADLTTHSLALHHDVLAQNP